MPSADRIRCRLLLSGMAAVIALLGCKIDRLGTHRPLPDTAPASYDAARYAPRGDSDSGNDATAADAGAPGRDADAAPPPTDADAGPRPMPDDEFCREMRGVVSCLRFEDGFDDEAAEGDPLHHDNITLVDGPFGQAIQLVDDSTMRIEARDELDLDHLTLELWARPDRMPARGQRAGLVDKHDQYGMFIRDRGRLVCAAAGERATSRPGKVTPDEWTHHACTYDGDRIRAYVNGEQVASTETEDSPSTEGDAPLHIGEDSPDGDDQLIGLVDELRIWNRALDEGEIAASAAR